VEDLARLRRSSKTEAGSSFGSWGTGFASEGTGDERGREPFRLLLRRGQPCPNLIGQREQPLHSPHDFLLLGQ